MRAIDRKQYHAEALQHLDTLKTCDAMRVGYYTDLANKWSIEYVLDEWITSIHSGNMSTCNLSKLNLTNLHYEQYLCVADEIDLRGNPLLHDNHRAVRNLMTLHDCNVHVLRGDSDESTISNE